VAGHALLASLQGFIKIHGTLLYFIEALSKSPSMYSEKVKLQDVVYNLHPLYFHCMLLAGEAN